MRPGRWLAVGALGVILGITAGWWALALWPLPDASPAWLLRTRAICFGTSPTGLPDTRGWMTLIGEPLLMLGVLFVISGDAVTAGLAALYRSRAGRAVLGATATALLIGVGAAGVRVAAAAAAWPGALAPAAPSPPSAAFRRLHRQPPPLDLVDQYGAPVRLARFRGRPVLVTFAYAHCETVCPLVVEEVLRACALARDLSPVVIVVTLDPWRDTPARLPAIAEQWQLPRDAFAASGDTDTVTATLERWTVSEQRNLGTGEIAHTPFVYLVDREGQIAYAVSGSVGAVALADLVRRL